MALASAVSMIVCHGTLLGDLGAAAGSGRIDEVRCKTGRQSKDCATVSFFVCWGE